jgi:small subunit ribosomal protein S3
MGQKIHPEGMRVGVIHDWKSNWYTGKKEFPQYLLEDIKIREHIYKKLSHAGLSDILIRKDKQRITVDIYTARPGIVIGKSGVEVDALRKELHAMTNKNVHININEIKRPELDAKLVAQSIAEQLQNRVSFRRAMKRALASAIRSGAQGVRIQCGGRLGGGEMSRSESYSEGRVPLHTIRADIDYGFTEARTTYGRIGVKVWINKGEIMPEGYEGVAGERTEADGRRRRGGAFEGLGASRESGRGRGQDREGLGPVRRRPPRGGGRGQGGRPRPGGGGGGQRPAGQGGQRPAGQGGQRPAGQGGQRPAGQGGQRPAGQGGQRPGGQRQGGGSRPAPRDRAGSQDNVERPRTDESGRSAEGREQPAIEPQVETTPAPVADAPDTTTPKTQHEDPTKLEQAGDEQAEKPKRSRAKKKPEGEKPEGGS